MPMFPSSTTPGRHARRRTAPGAHRAERPATVRRSLAVPTVAAGLVATSAVLGTAPSASAADGWRTDRAADIALNQLGDPYRYGANGPDAFDCSGLIQFAFRKAGFEHMPRTSDAQADHARRIAKDDLERGDLMFFTEGGDVYHAGIFLRWEDGHAVMLHSPQEDGQVERVRPWTTEWFAATVRR